MLHSRRLAPISSNKSAKQERSCPQHKWHQISVQLPVHYLLVGLLIRMVLPGVLGSPALSLLQQESSGYLRPKLMHGSTLMVQELLGRSHKLRPCHNTVIVTQMRHDVTFGR